MKHPSLEPTLNDAYNTFEVSEDAMVYSKRHGIKSAAILTITNDEDADNAAAYLAPRIQDKTVVEIGGGLGLLSLHMGQYAKRVFCIEANPVWASGFAVALYQHKPKNVSYLFGAADEFAGSIKADMAVIATHSGLDAMKAAALLFAPVVIDLYGEVVDSIKRGTAPPISPETEFAMALRREV